MTTPNMSSSLGASLIPISQNIGNNIPQPLSIKNSRLFIPQSNNE